MVQVDVHRGDDELAVVMLDVRELFLDVVRMMVIHEGDRARDLRVAPRLSMLHQLVANHVGDGQRAVGVALLFRHGVELLSQIGRQGHAQTEDRLSFHKLIPQTLGRVMDKRKPPSCTTSITTFQERTKFGFPTAENRACQGAVWNRADRCAIPCLALVFLGLPQAAFALLHGHAHGAEMPTGGTWFGYAVRFTAATALRHVPGIGIAQALSGKSSTPPWLRYARGGVAPTGLMTGIS